MSKSSKTEPLKVERPTDPESQMVYAHGNRALDAIKELDMPAVIFLFDGTKGEIHACSYKMEKLSPVQRRLFSAAALAYADAPADVHSDDKEEP